MAVQKLPCQQLQVSTSCSAASIDASARALPNRGILLLVKLVLLHLLLLGDPVALLRLGLKEC
jgi:hypothetical protein